MFEARLAGRVDAAGGISVRFPSRRSAVCAEKRALSVVTTFRLLDEGVAEIVGDVEPLGRHQIAARLQQPHAAGCDEPARLLVVDDLSASST